MFDKDLSSGDADRDSNSSGSSVYSFRARPMATCQRVIREGLGSARFHANGFLGLNCLTFRKRNSIRPREGVLCWDNVAEKNWLPCASIICLPAVTIAS